ncbi:hypothetical protein KPL78_01285 [Roseomonas sp. HJA6]|uniref:J domain-containing protein n=1 Tax=Roseomonas alba TaxID=2846776 RepID=A0ABS7A5K5_9PROT|nr:hypothetical protein [Neoroseomonas alba]MBW6396454.1 hypothetical protein [Neoroseomonas alba]
MNGDRHPERPLREWPLEQLAEQATLHPLQTAVLTTLLEEASHRRGRRAKALEERLRGMLAACAAMPPPAEGEIRRLRGTLAAAAQEITALRARIAALDAARTPLDPSGEAGDLHRRVHLAPDAPAWLVAEVRRAFRRRYHPDAVADRQRRPRAEEIFKRAEACFDAIERLRGP